MAGKNFFLMGWGSEYSRIYRKSPEGAAAYAKHYMDGLDRQRINRLFIG